MSSKTIVTCDGCGIEKEASDNTTELLAGIPKVDGWGQVQVIYDRQRVEWADACPDCRERIGKLLSEIRGYNV